LLSKSIKNPASSDRGFHAMGKVCDYLVWAIVAIVIIEKSVIQKIYTKIPRVETSDVW